MTDFFKRLLNQPEPPAAPDVPPAEMAAYLRSLDDRQWGRYAFSREPLEGKFTPQQKDAYTAAANACGAEWADKLAEEHGTRDPLTLCGELGLKLETAEEIRMAADKFKQRVANHTMPIGNLTGMTEEERMLIARWQP